MEHSYQFYKDADIFWFAALTLGMNVNKMC